VPVKKPSPTASTSLHEPRSVDAKGNGQHRKSHAMKSSEDLVIIAIAV
jgi:hypothetical protein